MLLLYVLWKRKFFPALFLRILYFCCFCAVEKVSRSAIKSWENFGGYLLLPPLRSLVFPFANTLTIIIWKCFPLSTAFHWFEGSSTGPAFVWSSRKWKNYVGKTSYLYRCVSVGRFWCIFNMSSRKHFYITVSTTTTLDQHWHNGGHTDFSGCEGQNLHSSLTYKILFFRKIDIKYHNHIENPHGGKSTLRIYSSLFSGESCSKRI